MICLTRSEISMITECIDHKLDTVAVSKVEDFLLRAMKINLSELDPKSEVFLLTPFNNRDKKESK